MMKKILIGIILIQILCIVAGTIFYFNKINDMECHNKEVIKALEIRDQELKDKTIEIRAISTDLERLHRELNECSLRNKGRF